MFISINSIFLFGLLILFTVSGYAQSGTIIVNIKGISTSQGTVEIGIFDNKEDFPRKGKQCIGASSTASSSSISHTFHNIPSGIYAIAVFHDVNGDKKFNKNWFGIPAERYGFSHNRYKRFGPPHFEDVAFEVKPGENMVLNITLK